MKLTLKRKILIMMLTVAFIPGLAGITATYLKGSRVFRDAMGRKIREIARQSAGKIDLLFGAELGRATALAKNAAERNRFFEKGEILGEGLCLTLFDGGGTLSASVGCKTSQPAVLHARSDEGPIIGPPSVRPGGEGFVLPLYLPALDKTGSAAGSLALYVDLGIYLDRQDWIELGASGHVNVVAGDGRVLYDPLMRGTDHAIPPDQMARITAEGLPWIVGTDEHGIESVIAAAPLLSRIATPAAQQTLYLVMTQPADEAFVEPIRSVLFGAAIPGFFLASLLILAIYMTLHKIVTPIDVLKEGASAFGRGDFGHRIHIRTGDEIEELAQEFNHMAGELEQLYVNLEGKVRERTLALEASNRELEKANRLKSEFLANMSHELRTPLNSIIGFSEVLADRLYGEINERQEKYLRNIHQSGRHLLDLINSILDLSKIEAGKMPINIEEFSVPHMVSEVCHGIRPLAEKRGISLGVEIGEGVDAMTGDRMKFKQVLYNLLGNAVKFTPDGGRVDLRAVVGEGWLTIAVVDTGIGIKEEDLGIIFESFRQVDGSHSRGYEGTGLGLSLTKKFIEMQGGTIAVTSEFGRGSVFTVRLPLTASAHKEPIISS